MNIDYVRWTAQTDFEDAHTISHETARGVLGYLPMEIIEYLDEHGCTRKRELRDALDSPRSEVDAAIKTLFVADIIQNIEGGIALAHDAVFVEPLVFPEGAE